MSEFSATSAVIATWFKVAKWKRASDQLNTFQIVLAIDGHRSFVILNYNRKYFDSQQRPDLDSLCQ